MSVEQMKKPVPVVVHAVGDPDEEAIWSWKEMKALERADLESRVLNAVTLLEVKGPQLMQEQSWLWTWKSMAHREQRWAYMETVYMDEEEKLSRLQSTIRALNEELELGRATKKRRLAGPKPPPGPPPHG